jgi:hypothetical protein
MSDTEKLSGAQALDLLIEVGQCPEDLSLEDLLGKDEAAKMKDKGRLQEAIATRVGELMRIEGVRTEDVPSRLEGLDVQSCEVQKAIVRALVGAGVLTIEALVATSMGGKLSEYTSVQGMIEKEAARLVGQAGWETALEVARLGRTDCSLDVRGKGFERLVELLPEATLAQIRMLSNDDHSHDLNLTLVETRLGQIAEQQDIEELRRWVSPDTVSTVEEVKAGVSVLVVRGEITAQEMIDLVETEGVEGDQEHSPLYWAYARNLSRIAHSQDTAVLVDWLGRGIANYEVTRELIVRAGEDAVTPTVALRVARDRQGMRGLDWSSVFKKKVGAALKQLTLAELVDQHESSYGDLADLVDEELRSPTRVAHLMRLAQQEMATE